MQIWPQRQSNIQMQQKPQFFPLSNFHQCQQFKKHCWVFNSIRFCTSDAFLFHKITLLTKYFSTKTLKIRGWPQAKEILIKFPLLHYPKSSHLLSLILSFSLSIDCQVNFFGMPIWCCLPICLYCSSALFIDDQPLSFFSTFAFSPLSSNVFNFIQ